VRRVAAAVIKKAPQFGLPDFIFTQPQQAALLPGADPLRPVNQILVENIGQLPR
jgi:hypothetical protein